MCVCSYSILGCIRCSGGVMCMGVVVPAVVDVEKRVQVDVAVC
jgi:hypothetical protein